LYRYDSGNVYRPHIDGAWPGSAISGTQEAGDERCDYDGYGDRWSRLTLLLYLNDNFDGGSTNFYYASADGGLDVRPVRPVAGSVFVFPHGENSDAPEMPFAPVHEGSTVITGRKYIVRTDVLYMLPKEQTEAERRKFKRHMDVNSNLFQAAPAPPPEGVDVNISRP
jgi:hypothetical protein